MVHNEEAIKFSITVDASDKLNFLFAIKPDGSIERGPGFTTEDEMSLKFWEAIEKAARPMPDNKPAPTPETGAYE